MVKNVSDYVDDVKKEFPFLTKREIYVIITYGLKILAWIIKWGGEIFIHNRTKDTATFYIGDVITDKEKKMKHWDKMFDKKEQINAVLKKQMYDGYFYFGLSEDQHLAFLDNKRAKNIKLFKLKTQLCHKGYAEHIWRIPYEDVPKWEIKVKDQILENAEYIGRNGRRY